VNLLEINTLFRLRAAQGVVGLAGKHGPERLERACARAIEVGDPSYRTVKGILAAGTEAAPPPEPTGDGGAAAHLHGPSQLFGNVVALPTPSTAPETDPGHPEHSHDERHEHRSQDHTEPGSCARLESGTSHDHTDSQEAS
jgi:hypothetical protein